MLPGADTLSPTRRGAYRSCLARPRFVGTAIMLVLVFACATLTASRIAQRGAPAAGDAHDGAIGVDGIGGGGIALSKLPVRYTLPAWARQPTTDADAASAAGGNATFVERDLPVAPAFSLDDFRRASRSQSGEDVYLMEHFFRGRTGGSFLEMGALDGVRFTNTHALEQQMNWRGVLLEANPLSYAELARNRPAALCVHAAVCGSANASAAAASFLPHPDIEAAACRDARPPSSPHRHREYPFVHYINKQRQPEVSGILEYMSESFMRKWHPNLRRADESTCVPCLPLSEILQAAGVRYVHFFSLDVEGAELQVLRSVDFDAVQFGVVAVEADEHNREKNEAVRELMRRSGYGMRGHHARSDWYVRE